MAATNKPATKRPRKPATETHAWEFKPRFRRNAFGWQSGPAIARIKQALAEINKVAKTKPTLAAEGAIELIERLSPALARIDSSSGAIGTAVGHAIDVLVPIIAKAPVDNSVRGAWLERLMQARVDDEIPYLESLTDHWGELCAAKELASTWADQLLDSTRLALGPDRAQRGHFRTTTACLSALFFAERYAEIAELLATEKFWPYKYWHVKALLATGKKSEALRCAESCRGPYAGDGPTQIDVVCEEILLSSGMLDEAYNRYAIRANQRGTYIATFRAIAKKYPHQPAIQILSDLVTSTPGEEGKWFAAAKDAGLYAEAIALAQRSPCNPLTLARAARDFAQQQPRFAVEAGLLALQYLVEGFGFDITSTDVHDAHQATLAAAHQLACVDEIRQRITALLPTNRSHANLAVLVLRGLQT